MLSRLDLNYRIKAGWHISAGWCRIGTYKAFLGELWPFIPVAERRPMKKLLIVSIGSILLFAFGLFVRPTLYRYDKMQINNALHVGLIVLLGIAIFSFIFFLLWLDRKNQNGQHILTSEKRLSENIQSARTELPKPSSVRKSGGQLVKKLLIVFTGSLILFAFGLFIWQMLYHSDKRAIIGKWENIDKYYYPSLQSLQFFKDGTLVSVDKNRTIGMGHYKFIDRHWIKIDSKGLSIIYKVDISKNTLTMRDADNNSIRFERIKI